VPFMFVYGPALLLEGSLTQILIACVGAIIGVYGVSVAMMGWIFTKVPIWARVVSFAAALMLIYPEFISSVVGLAILSAVVAINYLAKKRERGKSVVQVEA